MSDVGIERERETCQSSRDQGYSVARSERIDETEPPTAACFVVVLGGVWGRVGVPGDVVAPDMTRGLDVHLDQPTLVSIFVRAVEFSDGAARRGCGGERGGVEADGLVEGVEEPGGLLLGGGGGAEDGGLEPGVRVAVPVWGG